MSKKPNALEAGLGTILGTFANPQPVAPPSPAPPEETPPSPPTPRKAIPTPKQSSKPVKGKKSNADYYPTTVFMRKTIGKRVKQALLSMESEMDVSDVVEMLLTDWLTERGY